MQSTIYLNTIKSSGGTHGFEAVGADFTMSPSELMQRETTLGYATGQILDTLDIHSLLVPSIADLVMLGRIAEVEKRLHNVRRNIGLIARDAHDSKLKYGGGISRDYLASVIERIVTALPDAIAQHPQLIAVIKEIVLPLGEETNDDGCGVVIGQKSPRRMTEKEYAAYQEHQRHILESLR